jgi:Flp pilus assembly protein TadG
MTWLSAQIRHWRRDDSGAAVVELAFVLPFVIMLVIGCITGSQMVNAVSSMHFAVQEASRCYAVNKTTCNSATAAETYAQSRFLGAGSPEFEAVVAGCGRRVTARTTFHWQAGLFNLDVPLSATSCFPAADVT